MTGRILPSPPKNYVVGSPASDIRFTNVGGIPPEAGDSHPFRQRKPFQVFYFGLEYIYNPSNTKMANQELGKFIVDSRAAGKLDVQIRQDLIAAGWAETDVNRAFTETAIQPAAAIPSEIIEIKKHHRWPWVVAGVLVLAIAGTALGYFYYPVSPAKVLSKMVIGMENINTGEFTLEIKTKAPKAFEAKELNQYFKPGDDVLISVDTKIDGTDINNVKGSLAISSLTKSGKVEAEVREIGKTLYAEIVSGLPDQYELLTGHWVKFDTSSLTSVQTKSVDNMTEDQGKQLLDAAGAYLLSNTTVLGIEKVNGVSARHFGIALGKTAIENLAIKVSEIMGQPMTSEQKQSFETEFDKTRNNKLEVWIGKSDYKLEKILFYSESKLSDTEWVPYSITLNVKNYGAPVSISAPEKSVDFMQYLLGGIAPKQ